MPWAQERRKGQGAVDLPLDLVQGVEHTVGGVELHVVVDPVRLGVDLRVEPADVERDDEGLDAVSSVVSAGASAMAVDMLSTSSPSAGS